MTAQQFDRAFDRARTEYRSHEAFASTLRAMSRKAVVAALFAMGLLVSPAAVLLVAAYGLICGASRKAATRD